MQAGIPAAPFEKNWHELAFKRMLRFAAENGYDKVAWTTGEQQAERYNIGKVVDTVRFNKQGFVNSEVESTYELELYKDGRNIGVHLLSESELPQYIGKESAREIVEKGSGEIKYKDSKRLDANGMKGFYDEMLPRFVSKYAKKWGAKVGEVTMPELQDGYQTMHSVDVTEPMKESVMHGQPMFSYVPANDPTLTLQAATEMQQIRDKAIADGTFMKAPNGTPTNLDERAWLQVRTEAFKDWFDDWKLENLRDYLLGNKVVARLIGDEFEKDDTPLTDKVANFYQKEYGGKIIRKDFGEVMLDRRSVKDSLSHGIGRLKSAAFVAVPDIITKGRIIDEQSMWKGRNQDSFTFAAPVQIGDKKYVGIVIVTRGKELGNNRFYLHEVILQESLQNESFKTDTKADSHSGDIAKVLQKIVTAKSASKIVDENGEPLKVYHGTKDDIYIFDKKLLGLNTDDNASDEDYAKTAHLGFGLQARKKVLLQA